MVLAESPTLRLFLAVERGNLEKVKKEIENPVDSRRPLLQNGDELNVLEHRMNKIGAQRMESV